MYVSKGISRVSKLCRRKIKLLLKGAPQGPSFSADSVDHPWTLSLSGRVSGMPTRDRHCRRGRPWYS